MTRNSTIFGCVTDTSRYEVKAMDLLTKKRRLLLKNPIKIGTTIPSGFQDAIQNVDYVVMLFKSHMHLTTVNLISSNYYLYIRPQINIQIPLWIAAIL